MTQPVPEYINGEFFGFDEPPTLKRNHHHRQSIYGGFDDVDVATSHYEDPRTFKKVEEAYSVACDAIHSDQPTYTPFAPKPVYVTGPFTNDKDASEPVYDLDPINPIYATIDETLIPPTSENHVTNLTPTPSVISAWLNVTKPKGFRKEGIQPIEGKFVVNSTQYSIQGLSVRHTGGYVATQSSAKLIRSIICRTLKAQSLTKKSWPDIAYKSICALSQQLPPRHTLSLSFAVEDDQSLYLLDAGTSKTFVQLPNTNARQLESMPSISKTYEKTPPLSKLVTHVLPREGNTRIIQMNAEAANLFYESIPTIHNRTDPQEHAYHLSTSTSQQINQLVGVVVTVYNNTRPAL